MGVVTTLQRYNVTTYPTVCELPKRQFTFLGRSPTRQSYCGFIGKIWIAISKSAQNRQILGQETKICYEPTSRNTRNIPVSEGKAQRAPSYPNNVWFTNTKKGRMKQGWTLMYVYRRKSNTRSTLKVFIFILNNGKIKNHLRHSIMG